MTMLQKVISIALLAIAAVGGICAVQAEDAPAEDEWSVSADALPEAVRAVYDKFAAAGTVTNYVKEAEGEQIVYTADVVIGGAAFELELSELGEVLEVEAYDEADEAADDNDENEED